MTLIPGSFYVGGGFYGGLSGYGGSAEQADVKVAKPDDKAKPVPPLERPYALASPAVVPGFGKAPPLYTPWGIDWNVAWAMRRYSACILAYALTAGPIMGGTRTWEIRKKLDAPRADGSGLAGDTATPAESAPNLTGNGTTAAPEDKIKAALEAAFEPLWSDILCGLESLNFGRWLQEVIWEKRDGLMAPVELRSFLPWEAELLRDDYRRFAGFRHQQEERDARYAFLAVNDPHLDPINGYAWADCARDDWWRAVNSDDNGDRMEKKASGVQMMIGLPVGETFTDDKGNAVMPKDVAQTIVNASTAGQTFTVPLTPFARRDVVANPALADIPAVKVDRFDWGNIGPAITAQIARLDARDKRIVRAWRQAERAAMEGSHGTMAEAGVHKEVGVLSAEKIQDTYYRQVADQLVNRTLVTNWGPEWRGRVYPKPGQLADADKQFKQQAYVAAMGNPASDAGQAVDWRRTGTELGLAELPPEEVERRKQEAADKQAEMMDKMQAAAGANGKPANGNGGAGKPFGGRLGSVGA